MFQEVQGLRQIQASQPYQKCPAGCSEGGVKMAGSRREWKLNTLLLHRPVQRHYQPVFLQIKWNTHPLAGVTERARRSRRAGWACRTLKEMGRGTWVFLFGLDEAVIFYFSVKHSVIMVPNITNDGNYHSLSKRSVPTMMLPHTCMKQITVLPT